jgi:FKBP-type peptidyl-prolyl cis-trans isomerase FklB
LNIKKKSKQNMLLSFLYQLKINQMLKHNSMRTSTFIICLLIVASLPIDLSAQRRKKDKNNTKTEVALPVVMTPTDSLSYMVGISIGYNLRMSKIDAINSSFVAKGVEQSFNNDTTATSVQEASIYLNNFMTKMQSKAGANNVQIGKKFLEENKKVPGVVETASGLQIKIIKEGTGKSPVATDRVRCHYRGRLINGDEFDSSYERGEPAEFTLDGVIEGWTEGLQLMKEGGIYELFIPGNLAYGEKGGGQVIGPNETLIFEIELLEVLSE